MRIKTPVVFEPAAQLIVKTAARPGLLLLALLVAVSPVPLRAQVSFTSAVDLALRNSPRVRSAQAQVDAARNEVSAVRDVYIPSISAGSDFGEAFGYSPYPPTLFSINASSLVFNYAQRDYIRSASAGLKAAQLALADVQESVAEDAALSFVAVDYDQQQEAALTQQFGFANRLSEITQQRFSAGYDSEEDLLNSKLTAARLKLNLIHTQSTLATDRAHLAALLGLPIAGLRAEGGFPDDAFPVTDATPTDTGVETPAISAAFATARAKQEQAFGDKRFLYRPQINLIVQYNHYATFADSFHQLKNLYSNISNDNQAYALQITIPLLDRVRTSRARETAADAVRLFNDAQNTKMQIFDAQIKLNRSLAEIQARAQVASLERDLAELQLKAVRAQLAAPTGSGQAVTPKEEQNALINERAKFVSMLESSWQLRQSEVSLLRQTGRLLQWIRSLPAGAGNTPSTIPAVAPVRH